MQVSEQEWLHMILIAAKIIKATLHFSLLLFILWRQLKNTSFGSYLFNTNNLELFLGSAPLGRQKPMD